MCNNRRNSRGDEASRRRPVGEQGTGDAAKAAVPEAAMLDGTGRELTLQLRQCKSFLLNIVSVNLTVIHKNNKHLLISGSQISGAVCVIHFYD